MKETLKEWQNWSKKTLLVLGLIMIYHCIALKLSIFTPFKSVELAVIEENQNDLRYAMTAAQEDIIELHKKIKKL